MKLRKKSKQCCPTGAWALQAQRQGPDCGAPEAQGFIADPCDRSILLQSGDGPGGYGETGRPGGGGGLWGRAPERRRGFQRRGAAGQRRAPQQQKPWPLRADLGLCPWGGGLRRSLASSSPGPGPGRLRRAADRAPGARSRAGPAGGAAWEPHLPVPAGGRAEPELSHRRSRSAGWRETSRSSLQRPGIPIDRHWGQALPPQQGRRGGTRPRGAGCWRGARAPPEREGVPAPGPGGRPGSRRRLRRPRVVTVQASEAPGSGLRPRLRPRLRPALPGRGPGSGFGFR